MAKKLPDVGPLELSIIGVLNSFGEQSVSDIQQRLKGAGQPLAYTTVMTVLVRLHAKELVKRHKVGRLFIYSATERRDSSPSQILAKFKKTLFGSERLKPLLALLDTEENLSREELQELKKAIETKLKRL